MWNISKTLHHRRPQTVFLPIIVFCDYIPVSYQKYQIIATAEPGKQGMPMKGNKRHLTTSNQSWERASRRPTASRETNEGTGSGDPTTASQTNTPLMLLEAVSEMKTWETHERKPARGPTTASQSGRHVETNEGRQTKRETQTNGSQPETRPQHPSGRHMMGDSRPQHSRVGDTWRQTWETEGKPDHRERESHDGRQVKGDMGDPWREAS